MSKYFYPDNNEEIKVGDPIDLIVESANSMVTLHISQVDKETLENLAKMGYIRVEDKRVKEKTLLRKEDIPMDLGFYTDALEKSMRIDLSKLLKKTQKVAPALVYELLLMFIAKYLDEQYPDHIRDAKRLFAVDINGKVNELDPETVKTFKTFPAFRSVEDAGIACRILRPLKGDLFKNGK